MLSLHAPGGAMFSIESITCRREPVPRVAAGGSGVLVEEREVFSNFLKETYAYEEQAVL
jgi:hypothetical protein